MKGEGGQTVETLDSCRDTKEAATVEEDVGQMFFKLQECRLQSLLSWNVGARKGGMSVGAVCCCLESQWPCFPTNAANLRRSLG